jgi:hypothetical protein
MSSNQNNAAEAYLRRKQKNLDYFKAHLPRIFQILENQMLIRAELIVTPGAKDVDMVVDGKSCYRGLAKEYSQDEALEFLKNNPPEKPMKTFAPQWPGRYTAERFATTRMREILETSPVDPSTFQGYFRGSNFFPLIVFLGCGLGYHIETLVERSNILNAFIVERDPEKFALSLFTVDWARICSKFQRRGYAINFVIGFEADGVDMEELLWRHLKSAVPFYPFQTVYYNHLADVELARTAMAVGNDVVTLAAHWGDYDDQLIRLKNTEFNVRNGMTYVRNRKLAETGYPVVVVGSGPSIDHRIESLSACRDKVVVLSAGTGLRALVAAGIKPDLHIELDPGFFVYRAHRDLGEGVLSDVPLLAVNEVNPFVPEIFGKTRFYFKSENTIPALLGTADDTFAGCNPTCTNAALAISYRLGFRNIFLFGTDYGFEDPGYDHAGQSIWGAQADTDFAKDLRARTREKKRDIFPVDAVNGGKVFTQNDYFSAKRSVENLLLNLERVSPDLRVYNCADGAEIQFTSWLSKDQFASAVDQCGRSGGNDLENRLDSLEADLAPDVFDETLPNLAREFELESSRLSETVRKARLGGGRDLALLANELRMMVTQLVPRKGNSQITAEQLVMNQLLQGAMLKWVHAGLAHGLACEDGKLRREFLNNWRRQLLDFLNVLPSHFRQVVCDDRSMNENPWARTGPFAPEPEVVSEDLEVGNRS